MSDNSNISVSLVLLIVFFHSVWDLSGTWYDNWFFFFLKPGHFGCYEALDLFHALCFSLLPLIPLVEGKVGVRVLLHYSQEGVKVLIALSPFFIFCKAKCLWKFSNIHKSGENNTIQCMHTYLSHNLNTTNTWPFFFHLLPTPLFLFFLNWIIWKQVQNLDIIWFHIMSPVNTSECISTYKAIKKSAIPL